VCVCVCVFTHTVLSSLTNLLFYLSPQIETPVVEWGYPPGVPTPDPALLVGEPGKSALVCFMCDVLKSREVGLLLSLF